jgi:hypothetical protein
MGIDFLIFEVRIIIHFAVLDGNIIFIEDVILNSYITLKSSKLDNLSVILHSIFSVNKYWIIAWGYPEVKIFECVIFHL